MFHRFITFLLQRKINKLIAKGEYTVVRGVFDRRD